MHRTLDFGTKPVRKDSNVPQLRAYCPNIYTVTKTSHADLWITWLTQHEQLFYCIALEKDRRNVWKSGEGWGLGNKDLLLFLSNLGGGPLSLPLGFRLLFRRHASSPFPKTSHFQNSIPLLTIEVYYWDYGCACVKRYHIISLNTPTSLLHTTFRTRFLWHQSYHF